MTDKKSEPKENDEISIFDDIDEKSVKASLDAGVILPRLQPRLNTVYEVVVKSLPKSFNSDYGKTFSVDIDHDGMLKSLILPKSLRFQLKVQMKRKNIDSMSELIGKTLLIQKTIGDTKLYKNAELYSVQIK